MKNLKIIQTKSSPLIICNINGTIQIQGISIPENAVRLYKETYKWIDTYLTNNKEITFIFKIHYANSATLHLFVRMLKKINKKDNFINIIWYYELDDEDMMETGQTLSFVSSLDFELIGIAEIFKDFTL